MDSTAHSRHRPQCRRLGWAGLILVLALAPAAALPGATPPTLLRDIHQGAGPPLGSEPRFLADLRSSSLFTNHNTESGRVVWSVDRDGRLVELARLCEPCRTYAAVEPVWPQTERVFFVAPNHADGAVGSVLWVSDGTPGGTVPLRAGTEVLPLADLGASGDLLFSSPRAGGASGLFVSDGTPEGTRPLGLAGLDGWPRDPYGPSRGGARVVFGARHSTLGVEPWISDGTDSGTRLLADLSTGSASSMPESFHRLGTRWLFTADDGIHGRAPWVSDGTEAGTRVLADLSPGPDSNAFFDFLIGDGLAYISLQLADGSAPIWVTDGTPEGTAPTGLMGDFGNPRFRRGVVIGDELLVLALDESGSRRLTRYVPGNEPEAIGPQTGSNGGYLQTLGTRVVFANGGPAGVEIWATDGTAAGTRQVGDVCPGACSSFPVAVGVAVGTAYFGATRPGPRTELWATDGTPEGTRRVLDSATAEVPIRSVLLHRYRGSVEDVLYFSATDSEHGFELWRTDGRPEGTRLVADLLPGFSGGPGSFPRLLTPTATRLFFTATDETHGPGLWVSDGSEQGTVRVAGIPLGFAETSADVRTITAWGETAFVILEDAGTQQLWWTDGLASSRHLLTWAKPRYGEPQIVLKAFDDGAFLLGAEGLWRSDGTEPGTFRLRALTELSSSAALLNGRLLFGAADPAAPPPVNTDVELWSSDGTVSGTQRLRDLAPRAPSRPDRFLATRDAVYFIAATDDATRWLWKTDGNSGGTSRSVPLPPQSTDPRLIAEVGGHIVYRFTLRGESEVWAFDPQHGAQRIDGDLVPDEDRWAVLGKKLYFLPTSPGHLWSYDAATGRVREEADLLAVPPFPVSVHALGDRLLIWARQTAFPGPFRRSLWESDGRAGGSRLLLDFRTSLPNFPEIAEAGDFVFLRMDHPAAGAELARWAPRRPASPCVADEERLCLAGGRFTAQAEWFDPRSGERGTARAHPIAESERSGWFSFFDSEAVELALKMLDGGAVNGHYWALQGTLSTLEHATEIFDHATGERRLYPSPASDLCGRADVRAFGSIPPVEPAVSTTATVLPSPALGPPCAEDLRTLRLLDGRFQVDVVWHDPRSGKTGRGIAAAATPESGFFTFFADDNIELAVKILDGRAVNGRYWVFLGALTDLHYTATVTDTGTGDRWTHGNRNGDFCGRVDTRAF